MTTTICSLPPQQATDAAPVALAALEDINDVEAWLRTLSPGALCGRAHDPSFCPLARYLAAHTDADATISVGTRTYRLGASETELPPWARHFVSGVDAVPVRRDRIAGSRTLGPGITAAEALEVLKGVMALEKARQRLHDRLRVASVAPLP